jgi:hypothetical protein
MKTRRPEVSLEHVLATLERELIDATDEEILAAAAELGMHPSMKGSAAFVGVKSPLIRTLVTDVTGSGEPEPQPSLSRRERSGPRDS